MVLGMQSICLRQVQNQTKPIKANFLIMENYKTRWLWCALKKKLWTQSQLRYKKITNHLVLIKIYSKYYRSISLNNLLLKRRAFNTTTLPKIQKLNCTRLLEVSKIPPNHYRRQHTVNPLPWKSTRNHPSNLQHLASDNTKPRFELHSASNNNTWPWTTVHGLQSIWLYQNQNQTRISGRH